MQSRTDTGNPVLESPTSRLWMGDDRGTWQERLTAIVDMMRAMSRQTDPQEMVRDYSRRIASILPVDRALSISRRDLAAPDYRITRSTTWEENINPWTQKDRLPRLRGGLLGELLYGDEPRIIDDLAEVLQADDPALPYFEGMRSLLAVPNYDQGVALNMSVLLQAQPGAFDPEILPERVWMSNLFGRATHNLALMAELKRAYRVVDQELNLVADIQRSLLPKTLPVIQGLDLAVSYQTSRWAGGDYYDFFPLPENRWGIFLADVSGHGTPAAVLMAITHTIAHGFPGHPMPPSELLDHVNDRLARGYTTDGDRFVTAFYGIYDPAGRTLTYASAGHNPPRVKRCQDGSVAELDAAGGLPLGIFPGVKYAQATFPLQRGDQVIFYTDGITEALNPQGEGFGNDRLDEAISNCFLDAQGLVDTVIAAVARFTEGAPATDDRTMLVAKVS
jgi:sigma-B regulation protein RsbU (phosphoserine phosphatase)